MRTLMVAAFLVLISWQMNQASSSGSGLDLEEAEEFEEEESGPRVKRSPVALSYDIHQQFESGLGPHQVEHAIALTHTISHGLEHPLAHGISHTVSTTAGHGLLQTHPPPALHHPHAHPHHHKVGYGHGYSLGGYKGYTSQPHSVLGLHYGGFGVGIGYGGHGHGHGFYV